MKRKILVFFALVALMFSHSPTMADPVERSSTVASRQLVNVTIYNGGIALIHDRRRVALESGTNRIAWRDVSANMDATSALVESIGGRVDVLEQNFNYDLLDPSALLQKYVGRQVTVVHDARFAGEHDTRETARILSTNGGIVLRYKDRIETEVRGHIIFPESPKNFRDRPTLDLDLLSNQTGPQLLDLSYLTGGMAWRADYVGVLSPDQTHLSLNGVVTISNTSGIEYDNAQLQLVAGSVNMEGEPMGTAMTAISHVQSRARDGAFQPEFNQENYFAYHLYTLQRPTTILNNQTKQVTLLSARDIPIKESLELRGTSEYYQRSEPDLGDMIPVDVFVAFKNHGGDLGIPLPGGVMRIYKNDSHNLSQFVGSDTIDHTPKNESVRLYLGRAFDVTARKRQTDYEQHDCTSDSSYEITVSNAKDIAQDVWLIENIPGTWQITAESSQHVKSSASTANWLVHVPASSHSTLTYTAHTSWC